MQDFDILDARPLVWLVRTYMGPESRSTVKVLTGGLIGEHSEW